MSKKKKIDKNQRYKNKIERIEASRLARKNLKDLDRPRKPHPKMFIAEYTSGECPTCFLAIEQGQKVHYNSEGAIVHHMHKQVEPIYTFCPKCFLTLPCECSE